MALDERDRVHAAQTGREDHGRAPRLGRIVVIAGIVRQAARRERRHHFVISLLAEAALDEGGTARYTGGEKHRLLPFGVSANQMDQAVRNPEYDFEVAGSLVFVR